MASPAEFLCRLTHPHFRRRPGVAASRSQAEGLALACTFPSHQRWDFSLYPHPGLRQVSRAVAACLPSGMTTLLPFFLQGLVPDPLASPPGAISCVASICCVEQRCFPFCSDTLGFWHAGSGRALRDHDHVQSSGLSSSTS